MRRKQTKRRTKRGVRRASPSAPAAAAGESLTESRALLGRDEEARRVRLEPEDASIEVPPTSEGPVE